MSLEEFLEIFAEDEEIEKVAIDFHPLSSDTVMFQRSEICRGLATAGSNYKETPILHGWVQARCFIEEIRP